MFFSGGVWLLWGQGVPGVSLLGHGGQPVQVLPLPGELCLQGHSLPLSRKLSYGRVNLDVVSAAFL